jgi:hypothetical protein
LQCLLQAFTDFERRGQRAAQLPAAATALPIEATLSSEARSKPLNRGVKRVRM